MDFRSMHSVEETLATLAELGTDGCLLAGGTDVMVQLGNQQLSPRVLVHIERVHELAAISRNGHLRLGATATHAAIARAGAPVNGYSAVARASAQVGGWQTQTVGTVGGNVANASPAADLLPPLLVHGATVELASIRGTRRIPLDEFITGRRTTARAGDELISAIDLEPVGLRTFDAFVKVGRRSAMEVSIVALAVRLTMSEDRSTISDARIAVGSCGPAPFRATSAEMALIGEPLHDDVVRRAGLAVVARAELIDDVRASAAYRRRLLPRVLSKALAECRLAALTSEAS